MIRALNNALKRAAAARLLGIDDRDIDAITSGRVGLGKSAWKRLREELV